MSPAGESVVSKPTKEQWDEVAEKLDSQFDGVYLRCDGYLVYATLGRMKMKLVIYVYVNGYFKGEWYGRDDEMSEEARRFWRPSVRAHYPAKYIKFYEKLYGKRKCKKKGIYDKYIWPFHWWNRPLPFIRHLIKYNDNIEIIDRETHVTGIKALKEEVA